MAAKVSSVLRMMSSRYGTDSKEDKIVEAETKRSDLVTMDLLGSGGGGTDFKELNLEIKASPIWEKQLGLSSGDVFFDRGSENRNTSCSRRLDVPHFTRAPTPDFFRPPLPTAPNLELNLFSSSFPTGYQSVCTLDKVKFALERIQNLKPNPSSYFPSSSSTSSSIRQQQKQKRSRNDEEESVSMSPSTKEVEEDEGKKLLQAAGCPSCLSYVFVARANPECPRCNCLVPLPVVKKPRIDLNSSIITTTTISSSSPASALSEIS